MKKQCKDQSSIIHTVFDCVLSYIDDDDIDTRNSFSLVSRKWCELEGLTRKNVTVHMFYSPTPSRLHQRFPLLESLTLKGYPLRSPEIASIDITPWIQDISASNSFKCLKEVCICGTSVHDSDLELLSRTRGKDLKVLKICKCQGFSTDGLLHVATYCKYLRILCLKDNSITRNDAKWLRTLASCFTCMESLDIGNTCSEWDVEDLILLAKNCSKSLESLKIHGCDLIDLVDVFSYAVNLQDFAGGGYKKIDEYAGFKFPPKLRRMGIYRIRKSMFPVLLPLADQLRELNLRRARLDRDDECYLIQRCPNLEVLYTDNTGHGNEKLEVIGQFCKKLCKLKITGFGSVSSKGLVAIAQGCLNLEYLHIRVRVVSNEAMECIGSHLKNLRNFRMTFGYAAHDQTALPLDDGIRAMLVGCSKLKWLGIYNRELTDVGLDYIGKYGRNLRYLSLGYIGESDAGLVQLSKGCPNLRKLEIQICPFSKQTLSTLMFNVTSLRYIWVHNGRGNTYAAMIRPTFDL
ncbi:hypothetical protein CTI12_AA312910 [Artemisia annua]|uniref:COI1 F-box domain-containing protein n=1 Tax=Artemisia annua TaxID=35608 RepID=A0A2U1N3H3_ARTAN|nr:hypothetical protein CTI12_AA312910 [Artemisia annua]